MAQGSRPRRITPKVRNQVCTLHENRGMKKCWGTLRRGGICSNRATYTAVPGVMPTCKVHRHQRKVSAWCKASLGCGFQCGELLEWEPHGFQLCPRHRETLVTCHFLKIPIEIRCRIYQLLLPDTNIPPRFAASRSLTADGRQVHMAILRLNHQIHDEAARLLYCTRVFAIQVSDSTLSMCNLPDKYEQYVRYGSSF